MQSVLVLADERSGRSWKSSIRAAPAGGGEMLFYVRRHTCADGAFEWYVMNGHTRRRASKHFPTRAAAVAERAKLQVKLELAQEQVLKRTLTRTGPQKYRTSGPR